MRNFVIMKKSEGDYTDFIEIEKSAPHIIVEIIEYVPNSPLSSEDNGLVEKTKQKSTYPAASEIW